jgi:ubiquinone biosynthesis protein
VRLVGFRRHLRWDDMLWELHHIMREEMDCRYEASSTRRMRQRLRAHGIYVPRVFHATKRVLITEFVDGVLMADYIQATDADPERVQAWLADNSIDPFDVGRRLALSLLRQMIEDNLYHGDLHPGNIMLLRGNGVALIDFGSCSFSERQFLEFYRLLFFALARRDYARAADLAFHLSGTMPPEVDTDAVRRRFASAYKTWGRHTAVRGLPFHQKSVTVVYNAMVRILYEHQCTMDWSVLRLRRALETLDSSLVYLIPDADYTRILGDYFRQADQRMSSRVRRALPAALAAAGSALDLPRRVDEYTLFQAEILRRHGRVFQTATNRAVYALSTLVGQVALVSLLATGLAVAALAAQRDTLRLPGLAAVERLLPSLPPLDWQVWALALTALTGTSLAMIRLRGRLRRHEPRTAERVAAV